MQYVFAKCPVVRLGRVSVQRALFGLAISTCLVFQVTSRAEANSSQANEDNSAHAANSVCDPFNKQGSLGQDRGLVGELFYVPDVKKRPAISNMNELYRHAVRADHVVYLNDVNVPTRAFDRGFNTQDGGLLKTPMGKDLHEFFALHLESELTLSKEDHEKPGYYQFAVLADDGVAVSIDGETLLNDTAHHPTKMICSTTAVHLNKSARVPITIDYYQGPRRHIALVLLYRYVKKQEKSNGKHAMEAEPYCKKSGNALFFDSNKVPSAPQKAWKEMMARGWKVVPASNFYIPGDRERNPCKKGTSAKK
jgi:hypothetical protein